MHRPKDQKQVFFFEKLKIVVKKKTALMVKFHMTLSVCDTLYHKNNLVYTSFFPQFLIFQKNNSVET